MNTSLGVVAEMLYCNSASDRNASKVPLQASAGMKWFRSKVRFGSRLALFALAMQFLLSFGHFHGGAQAASASMDAKRSGYFAIAHLHALDRVSHVNASGAVRLKASGAGVAGAITSGQESVKLAGVRPPRWGQYDANARHAFGKPVTLFDGKSLDAWTVQHPEKPMGWRIEDGVMTNEPHGNNLVSKEKFQDFKIAAEYRLAEGSNSGIYLRGRYELQVLDDYGKMPESHGHMAIYARKAPDRNASRPAGEWQAMEATLVGNRVTVVLNGVKVHSNAAIEGITGGALDANELEPGPVMIQGDHEGSGSARSR